MNGFDVNVLATGSTGNATIIDNELLLDCGVPYKVLKPYEKQLKLVFISHEHGDHFKASTIKALAKARPTLRFCAGQHLAGKLLAAGVKPRNIDVLELGFSYSYWHRFVLKPVQLHHNVENYGLKISKPPGRRLLYAVDTGSMDGVEAKDFDLYLLEANHTQAEIEARLEAKQAAGEYAYEIQAAQNHLSFEQAREWLATQMGPNSLWLPMHGHVQKEGEDNGRGQMDKDCC